jgi:hypothetical protein
MIPDSLDQLELPEKKKTEEPSGTFTTFVSSFQVFFSLRVLSDPLGSGTEQVLLINAENG